MQSLKAQFDALAEDGEIPLPELDERVAALSDEFLKQASEGERQALQQWLESEIDSISFKPGSADESGQARVLKLGLARLKSKASSLGR